MPTEHKSTDRHSEAMRLIRKIEDQDYQALGGPLRLFQPWLELCALATGCQHRPRLLPPDAHLVERTLTYVTAAEPDDFAASPTDAALE
jgi:hypothetical protein